MSGTARDHLCVYQQSLIARQLSLGLRELDLERSRIDLGQYLSGFYEIAFLKQNFDQFWPSTRLLTVTVFRGVTVPRPDR